MDRIARLDNPLGALSFTRQREDHWWESGWTIRGEEAYCSKRYTVPCSAELDALLWLGEQEAKAEREGSINPPARRLPVVTLLVGDRERKFYADERLQEYRAIDNPHDRIHEDEVDGSMREIIERERS